MLWRSCTHVFRVCGFEHERTGNGEIETAVGWMNIFLAFLLWFGVWQTSATFSMHLTQPKQSFLSPSESLDVAILRSLMVLLPRRWNCKWESRDHLLQTLGNWRCVAGVSHPSDGLTGDWRQTNINKRQWIMKVYSGEPRLVKGTLGLIGVYSWTKPKHSGSCSKLRKFLPPRAACSSHCGTNCQASSTRWAPQRVASHTPPCLLRTGSSPGQNRASWVSYQASVQEQSLQQVWNILDM